MGTLSTSSACHGCHAGTAGKIEKGGPGPGTWWHRSSGGDIRTESFNGGASYAYQVEGEWQRVHSGVMVRSASARRFVCSSGAQRCNVVRRRGPQPRPQVCPMRPALLRHKQEGDSTLVQHATVWKPTQGRCLRSSPTHE